MSLVWAASIMVFFLAGASQAPSGAAPPSAGMGTLSGQVTRWPASPVAGPGISSAAAPAPGVKIIIYGAGRQEITSVTTDAHGQYRAALPPGNYLIEMAQGRGREFTKDLPAMVKITPGRETRLNLALDRGIR